MRNVIFFVLILLQVTLFAQWEEVELPTSDNLKKIHFVNDEVGFMIGDTIILKTEDGGITWNQNYAVKDYTINTIAGDDSLIICVGTNGLFLRSLDYGASWEQLDFPVNTALNKVSVKSSLVFVKVYHKDLYKSTDKGKNWELVIVDRPEGYELINVEITDFIIIDENHAYATIKKDTPLPTYYYYGSVYKTMDGGETWDLCHLSPYEMISIINEIYNAQNKLIVLGDRGAETNKLFNCTDWQKVSDQKFSDIVYNNNGKFYFTNQNEIFISDTSFQEFSLDSTFAQGVLNILDIKFTPTGKGFVLARVDSNTTKLLKKEELTKVKINNTERYYYLQQNYPNPFNPTTKIQFSIPQSSEVSIKIYDIMGREIKTLLNENKTQEIMK